LKSSELKERTNDYADIKSRRLRKKERKNERKKERKKERKLNRKNYQHFCSALAFRGVAETIFMLDIVF
jgi:hypothetical protein